VNSFDITSHYINAQKVSSRAQRGISQTIPKGKLRGSSLRSEWQCYLWDRF